MKKVFIGVLAALMLIAFTACEQTPVELPKAVVSATIRQEGVFLVGQPFDASKFVVDVTYSDGSVVPLTGTNVTVETGASAVVNGQTVTAIAGKDLKGQDVTVKTSLVAYDIESLSVAGKLPEIAYANGVENPSANLKKYASDLTVSANYIDSTGVLQSVELAGSAWTITRDNMTDGAPSEDEPTKTGSATINGGFGTNTKSTTISATFTYVAPEDTESTYEWFDHQIVYGQVAASKTVSYVQRGEFDADDMIKLYKVYAPEGATELGDDYYLVPLTTSDYITSGLTLKLASPYTNASITNDISDRFGTASTANVNFAMTYVGNEGTGAYATKTAVDGSVVIADLESVTANTVDGITVESFTGDITSTSTITLTDILADYPLTLSVSVASTVTQTAPLAIGQQYSNLVGTSIIANVATWKSGIQAETGYVVNEAATAYGTLTFNPGATANETTTAAQQTVAWSFVPTVQYEDSNSSTSNLGSGTISPYVAGKTN